jgi:hypothetical protein
VLDLDPTEHQAPTGFERMKVESVAYPEMHRDSRDSGTRARPRPLHGSHCARCVDNRDLTRQAFSDRTAGGSLAMPAFAKNPKVIIGTIVVLWVAYIIYANFQPKVVDFYLLPFGVIIQFKLSSVIIGAAIFGVLATLIIQYLWRRPSNDTSSVASPSSPAPAPAPRSSTVA